MLDTGVSKSLMYVCGGRSVENQRFSSSSRGWGEFFQKRVQIFSSSSFNFILRAATVCSVGNLDMICTHPDSR